MNKRTLYPGIDYFDARFTHAQREAMRRVDPSCREHLARAFIEDRMRAAFVRDLPMSVQEIYHRSAGPKVHEGTLIIQNIDYANDCSEQENVVNLWEMDIELFNHVPMSDDRPEQSFTGRRSDLRQIDFNLGLDELLDLTGEFD